MQSKKEEPFFARFLEAQELGEAQLEEANGGCWTFPKEKPPIFVTLAYPSDSDRDVTSL